MQVRMLCACSVVTRRENLLRNTHNIKAVAAVNIYKIFQFSTLTVSVTPKNKAQPTTCTRSSPRKLGRKFKKAQATTHKPEKQPTPELTSDPHTFWPDVEADGDTVAQAAGGGDAVSQAGCGERSADSYTRDTIRESCVNRAGLLRCLSAIHS